MLISSNNFQVGNKAMASILLLYYHLINENGFTNDQTVYIDPDDFNGFDFLNTKIDESEGYSLDIDESLIREGAVICLLCDLNDMITEYENDYLSQPITKKIINAYREGKLSAISETQRLFDLLKAPENELNYESYQKCLSKIYKKYVIGRFKRML